MKWTVKLISVFIVSISVSLCLNQSALGQSHQTREPNPLKQKDKNSDGKLSLSEFAGPEHIFSIIDKDKDGYITLQEMSQSREEVDGLRETRGHESSQRLAKIDNEFYPDTDNAPVLEFYFDAPIKGNITNITPYGVWEGDPGIWEAADEMQFGTKTYHDPVYSAAKGLVVDVDKEFKHITIRYGKNYSFIMHHIVDFPEEIKIGVKVEAKTLLGYTEYVGGYANATWEIQLVGKKGDVYRCFPPIDYFSPASRKKLNSIKDETPLKEWGEDSWTVRKGSKSWIEDIGSDEWWASPHTLGYHYDGPESFEDFLKEKNMLHILKDYK